MNYSFLFLLKSYFQSRVHDLQFLIGLMNYERANPLSPFLKCFAVFLTVLDPWEEEMRRKEKDITGLLNLFEDRSYTFFSSWYGINQCLSLLWGRDMLFCPGGKEKDRRIWTILWGTCCNSWGWCCPGQKVVYQWYLWVPSNFSFFWDIKIYKVIPF